MKSPSANHALEQRIADLQQQVVQLQLQLLAANNRQAPVLHEHTPQYQIIDEQSELISRWNFDGDLLYANEAYYQFFGDHLRPQSHPTRRRVPLPYPDEEIQRYIEQMRQLTPGDPILSIEEQLKDQDGNLHWIHWVNHVFFDPHGIPIEIQSIGRNITRRRQAEAALHQAHLEMESKIQQRTQQLEALNQALLQEVAERQRAEAELEAQRNFLDRILNAIPNHVYVKDRQGRFILANDAGARLYNATRQQLSGKTGSDFIFDTHLTQQFLRTNLEVMDTLQEKRQVEEHFVDLNGREHYVQTDVIPLIDADGHANQVLIVNTDITERKRIELELSAQRTFLRQVIDMIPSMIFVRDRPGRYVLVNEAMAHAVGRTVEDMTGLFDTDINPNTQQSAEFHAENIVVMDTGCEVFIREQETTFPDGRTRWLQVSKRPLASTGSSSNQVVCVLTDVTERRKMFIELEEQRNLLQQVFDLAPISIYVKDRAGKFVMVNQKFARFYNQKAEELTGVKEVDIYPDRELAEFFHRQDLRLMNTLKHMEPQTRLVSDVNGRQFWQSTVKRPLVSPDGKANLILCISSDITKLKQAQESMQKQRAFLRQVIDTNPNLMFVLDRSGHYILANQAMADLYGANQEDMANKTIFDLNAAHPQQAQRWMEHNTQILKEGKEDTMLEEQVWDVHGRTRWMQTHLRPLRGLGRQSGWLAGVSTDITDQVLAREALRESEARYRGLFENAPIAIFEIDFSGLPDTMRLLSANRKAETIYGRTLEELNQQPASAIFAAESLPVQGRYVEDILRLKPVTFESVHLRADGSAFPVRISITPSPLDGIARATVTVQDISAEKDLLAARQGIITERERIAREIHRGIVQDLAAIRMRAALWHDLVDNNPQKMHVELNLLQETLKKNIDSTRRSIFALRPVSIEDIGFFQSLNEFVEAFNELHSVQAHLTLYGGQRIIPPAIENTLFHIIQETLHNAGKHAQASHIHIRLNLRLPHMVRLAIEDDGVGFDTSALSRARLHGHIGISQIQQQVKDLNGKLSIKSAPGQGTLINITLPADLLPMPPEPAQSAPPPKQAK